MSSFFRDKLSIIIAISISAIIVLLKYYNTSYGIDSIWDEGYLLLSLVNKNEIEISNWQNLVRIILEEDDFDIYKLKIFRLFLQLSTAIIFTLGCFRWFIINYPSPSKTNKFLVFFPNL